MAPFTAQQYIELFHLLFLDQLGRKADKKVIVLKGGCNLRFFFKSIRYSEDMDFDLSNIPVHVFREQVNAIFKSQPFSQILESRKIRLEHITEAKQTDTTQRWKIGLITPACPLPLPTKIEFSRRCRKEDGVLASIVPDIIRAYELTPILCRHYIAESAFRQKFAALIGRKAPQARDIFDLHLLLQWLPRRKPKTPTNKTQIASAQNRALAIDFESFKSQVIPFLPVDSQQRYSSAEVWDTIVMEVVEALEGLAQ